MHLLLRVTDKFNVLKAHMVVSWNAVLWIISFPYEKLYWQTLGLPWRFFNPIFLPLTLRAHIALFDDSIGAISCNNNAYAGLNVSAKLFGVIPFPQIGIPTDIPAYEL
jgi:hypothetical protein